MLFNSKIQRWILSLLILCLPSLSSAQEGVTVYTLTTPDTLVNISSTNQKLTWVKPAYNTGTFTYRIGKESAASSTVWCLYAKWKLPAGATVQTVRLQLDVFAPDLIGTAPFEVAPAGWSGSITGSGNPQFFPGYYEGYYMTVSEPLDFTFDTPQTETIGLLFTIKDQSKGISGRAFFTGSDLKNDASLYAPTTLRLLVEGQDHDQLQLTKSGVISTVNSRATPYKLPYNESFQAQGRLNRYDNVNKGVGVNNYKHNNWVTTNGLNGNSIVNTFSTVKTTTNTDNYKIIRTSQIQAKVDGIAAPVTGLLKFRSPWDVSAPNQWQSISGNTVKDDIFYDEETDFFAQRGYAVGRAVTDQTINGETFYPLGWGDGVSDQQTDGSFGYRGFVFSTATPSIAANFKGHLRTGSPELGDQKNQRRSDGWLMVYESMGEIWLTVKSLNGVWSKETRLSFGTASAKNPSISNTLYKYSINRAIITWVENGRVYLQPIEISQTYDSYSLYWDHSPTPPARQYTYLATSSVPPRPDSRPVVQLYSTNGTDLILWWACEKNNGGIVSGKVEFADIYNSNFNQGVYSPLNGYLGIESDVSTGSTDKYPVLIYYPAAFGFPERKAVYYLGYGYASGNRIVQYDVSTEGTTVLPVNNFEYTFTGLSGAANTTSASFTLAATALINGQNCTEVYAKATYSGNGTPSLSKIYNSTDKVALMVQNTSNFGSPVYEVNMQQGSNWYKATGGSTMTLIGSNISGIFTTAQVGANDRKSIFVKTNTSPASLVLYSGSGILNKSESVLYADVRSVRNYTTLTGVSKTAILDFAGALVEPVDSLESGSVLCAVKLISPDQNSIIVRQPDSIKTALAVDVVRNGVAIRSYSAGVWETLSVNSFEDVQDGDVLVFRLGFPVAASTGYEIYDFNGTSLTKPEETAKPATELKVLETGVAVYPNPFNPATSIAVSLESPEVVRVTVFNILGQLVTDFGRSDLGAGVHTFPFDGRLLASGTYFYRVEIGDKVKTGKLQLLK